MKRNWKVGELAKLTGLTIRTLRYYDQIGLFSPSYHSHSGHRLYTESDIARLQQILSLKELGLSLDEIKAVLADDRINLFEIISLQIGRIKQTMLAQQKLLQELEHVSNLMQRNESLTIDDFTKLLAMMRLSHEKYFTEQRVNWNAHLDRLGDFLDKNLESYSEMEDD
ncbi:MerR family transcriptional regulator [Paenibacillus durus]|uniref:MerR family transcriptional regulator n=1 Tax=Paenibacillus durus TaxID=44251 RepID=A0A089HTE9_PAEDU|nr:MerR family transcriptional regulator [Paenibacillus durus]AIQ14020.1 MerR family transcriptional regulator [Paenibacillus durus]